MKLLISLSTIIILLLAGCSDSPRRQLSSSERAADMAWVFSKFDHNYAPAQYKESLHNFNYEDTKAKFLEEAKKDQSNEDFYRLVNRFVATFKDAHTSVFLQVSQLPGRSRIAYLGFSGIRNGNEFIVNKLLPTIKSSSFPIKSGDKITHIDGKPVLNAVDEILTSHVNLGNQQANYTALLNSLFTRDLTTFPVPEKQNVVLTITKGVGKTREVKLPWIIKDAAVFMNEQRTAIRSLSPNPKKNLSALIEKYAPFVGGSVLSYNKLIELFINNKEPKILEALLNYNSSISYHDSFEYFAHHDLWTKIDLVKKFYEVEETDEQANEKKKEEDAIQSVIASRSLPVKNYSVSGANLFPAALMITSKGERLGYLKISSFSIQADDDQAVRELKRTLNYFKDLSVDGLVIDLLDNGGGSLSLGAKLAQTLAAFNIDMPSMEFQLNDNWVDTFEGLALSTDTSDAEREIADRVFQTLLEDIDSGLKISRRHPLKSLFPFGINPNLDVTKEDAKPLFKVAVLVNEMCASMCDIFAGMLQDNKLATVIGQQTMGAGGNVTTHIQSPNAGFMLQQTESLVVRSNGEYLENNGVKPDIAVETYKDIRSKYRKTLKAAVGFLTKN